MPEISPLQRDVQQALGRALLRLQHLEQVLKALVLPRFVSAAPSAAAVGFQKRTDEVMSSPLGWLKEELLAKYVRPEGTEADDMELDRAAQKGHLSFRLQISIPPQDHARLEQHLNIVHERRNRVVHHFLETFDLLTDESCESALHYLHETHQLLDAHQGEILAFAKWAAGPQKAMAALMSSQAFLKSLVGDTEGPELRTENVAGVVVAQSLQMEHVLVEDARSIRYAVTRKTFAGDWGTLKRGDAVELMVTKEPLPEVLVAWSALPSAASN